MLDYLHPLKVPGQILCKVHITLQECQAVTLILCTIVFHLSGEMFALHLDNSNTKAYICNKGGTVSLSFQASVLHFKSG